MSNRVGNKTTRVRILLADDHPLLRQALRIVIEKEPDFSIVAEASDGEEAIKLAMSLVPDVVIMDISMPKINGIEATKQIKAACPRVAILVLTVHSELEYVFSMVRAGADGYLTKAIYGDEVVNAIRAVMHRETVLNSSVWQQIVKRISELYTEPVALETGDKLNYRELQVLRLAAQGASNKEIARKLNLSTRTVKAYLGDIFLKLNVSSRTGAVVESLRKGILTMQDLEP